MEHKVWFDDNIGAVCLKLHGTFTREDSPEFMDQIEMYYRGQAHRYLLCDLSEGGAEVPTDRQYRKWLMEKYTQIGFDRIAILNAPPAMRMLAKIVLATLSKLNQVKFFSSEQNAEEWLKEQSLIETKEN